MPVFNDHTRLGDFHIATIFRADHLHLLRKHRNPLVALYGGDLQLVTTEEGQKYYTSSQHPGMALVINKHRQRTKTANIGKEPVLVGEHEYERSVRIPVQSSVTYYKVYAIPLHRIARLVQVNNEFFTLVLLDQKLLNAREKLRSSWVGVLDSDEPKSQCNEGCSYGPAPHTCFYKIEGAALGQSRMLPEDQWPDNFEQDKEIPGLGIMHQCGWKKE